MAKRRDADKERFWRGVVSRQVGSRLSVREFCRRERLTECSFYAWRRTLAERDGQPARAHRQPAGADRQPAFLPVTLHDPAAHDDRLNGDASIEIALAAGRVLRLPGSTPARRLAEIVAALDVAATASHARAAEGGR